MPMKKLRHNMPLQERFERFFEKRGEDECWNWLGTKCGGKRGGYGGIRIGRAMVKANRVSYELYNGPIPYGMQVMHSCDNRACVNPAHLSLGNNFTNQMDAWKRDRFKDRPGRKLSPEDVKDILDAPGPQKEIADRYGVSQGFISRIKNGLRGHGVLAIGEV